MAKNDAPPLESLAHLSKPDLAALFVKLFDRPPPRHVQRDFLLRSVAYRLQGQAHGGLSASARKQLSKIALGVQSGKNRRPFEAAAIKPGTRLVRSWQGETHEVITTEAGFTYREKHYRSLSEIARLITGTRWSGPLFFGLKTNRTKESWQRHGR